MAIWAATLPRWKYDGKKALVISNACHWVSVLCVCVDLSFKAYVKFTKIPVLHFSLPHITAAEIFLIPHTRLKKIYSGHPPTSTERIIKMHLKSSSIPLPDCDI